MVPIVITPSFYMKFKQNFIKFLKNSSHTKKLLHNFCLQCNCLSANGSMSALNGCECHSVRENYSIAYPTS